jgi:DNA polymerase-3 subunit epsilon
MTWPTLAIVDLETTGGKAGVHRVTEIGIIRVEHGVVTERYQTLVNPEQAIPPYITEITGITNALVADAPVFAEVALKVAELCADAIFVAHNASFDAGFLRAELAAEGLPLHNPILCSVKLSRRLFPEYPKHNLSTLIERHNLVCDSRHRALADADAVWQFLSLLPVLHSEARIAAAIKQSTATPAAVARRSLWPRSETLRYAPYQF